MRRGDRNKPFSLLEVAWISWFSFASLIALDAFSSWKDFLSSYDLPESWSQERYQTYREVMTDLGSLQREREIERANNYVFQDPKELMAQAETLGEKMALASSLGYFSANYERQEETNK